ncbi:serine O-acetyltransferase, partial [Vibrio harveyi]
MKHCEKQKVWNKIVSEAREMSEQEPMLASFYHATIIKHESLCAALSYILANKLNT